MPLKKLVDDLAHPEVILHPDVYDKLLARLKVRYESELTPELWKDLIRSYDEDDYTPQDFLDETNYIAQNVVDCYIKENNITTVDDVQAEWWAAELWDGSQSFWFEMSAVIAQNLNFIERLLENSKKEIEGLFPSCDKVFGDKATQFLIDLAFQHNLYDYTKIVKPHLVDMRRMLNISGQIVEEIFSSRIFERERMIGEIYRLLESFRREPSTEKTNYYQRFPAGKILLSGQFLANLRTLKGFRDPYSHGGSSDGGLEADFSKGIIALIEKQYGVLPTIYRLLAGKKPNELRSH